MKFSIENPSDILAFVLSVVQGSWLPSVDFLVPTPTAQLDNRSILPRVTVRVALLFYNMSVPLTNALVHKIQQVREGKV